MNMSHPCDSAFDASRGLEFSGEVYTGYVCMSTTLVVTTPTNSLEGIARYDRKQALEVRIPRVCTFLRSVDSKQSLLATL